MKNGNPNITSLSGVTGFGRELGARNNSNQAGGKLLEVTKHRNGINLAIIILFVFQQAGNAWVVRNTNASAARVQIPGCRGGEVMKIAATDAAHPQRNISAAEAVTPAEMACQAACCKMSCNSSLSPTRRNSIETLSSYRYEH